ncbi:MAG: hypothetical protein GF400_00625, partial [Candidatus Eisenbacteria bacterium]|nr:hypothetical protein [Candidatus Eisenbacteria bacterium]
MRARPAAAAALVLTAVCLASAGCDGHEFDGVDLREHVPAQYLEAVRASLELSGDNSGQILAALREAGKGERESLAYLISYLP